VSPANSKTSSPAAVGPPSQNKNRPLRLFYRARAQSLVKTLLGLTILFCTIISLRAQTSVEIDLQEQTAYLIRNGRVVLSTPVSTGRYGHLTGNGAFKVIEKELNHFSNMYGKIVDAGGNNIVPDADADMPVPRGGKFIPASMRYFMRFDGANGMHAGYVPGYPASHSCVRLPEENAIAFYNAVEVGTPVTVFGRAPRGRYSGQSRSAMFRERNPFVDSRFDPYFDRRFVPPIWRP
jgi:lipoprotein-anchoring transpeptidase ErfK/SrfK